MRRGGWDHAFRTNGHALRRPQPEFEKGVAPGHTMLSSLPGLGAVFLAAWLCSSSRSSIRLRVVLSALAVQIGIAIIVLKLPAGRTALQSMAAGVEALLSYSRVGVTLLFGDLISPSVHNSIFLFVLPAIIFFSALVSVLYHLGWMQFLIGILGGGIGRVIGVDRIEGLFAAANIFLGQTESPLVIRPYLRDLGLAQTFAVMTSGMAGVAGTVLAAYAQIGIRLDYLLAASFMSAPAGLLMAKIVMPDTEADRQYAGRVTPTEASGDVARERGNIILAASEGTQTGIRIAAGVGGMLLAFSALIALVNGLLGFGGQTIGIDGLTVQGVLGHVLAPVMYLFGLTWPEAVATGSLFGEKLILNEFVAYVDYVGVQHTLSPHAQAVAIFALCGFANLGSIAIQVAVLGSISKENRALVSKLGLRRFSPRRWPIFLMRQSQV
ncbi:MAG TPA: nucleoside transporter C-terminal domain-containing protein [Sphingomicrobium sp.]